MVGEHPRVWYPKAVSKMSFQNSETFNMPDTTMLCCISYFYGHYGKSPGKEVKAYFGHCFRASPSIMLERAWLRMQSGSQFLIAGVSSHDLWTGSWQEDQKPDRNQGPCQSLKNSSLQNNSPQTWGYGSYFGIKPSYLCCCY